MARPASQGCGLGSATEPVAAESSKESPAKPTAASTLAAGKGRPRSARPLLVPSSSCAAAAISTLKEGSHTYVRTCTSAHALDTHTHTWVRVPRMHACHEHLKEAHVHVLVCMHMLYVHTRFLVSHWSRGRPPGASSCTRAKRPMLLRRAATKAMRSFASRGSKPASWKLDQITECSSKKSAAFTATSRSVNASSSAGVASSTGGLVGSDAGFAWPSPSL